MIEKTDLILVRVDSWGTWEERLPRQKAFSKEIILAVRYESWVIYYWWRKSLLGRENSMYKSLRQEEYARIKELTESQYDWSGDQGGDWQEKKLVARQAGTRPSKITGQFGLCLKKSPKNFKINNWFALSLQCREHIRKG